MFICLSKYCNKFLQTQRHLSKRSFSYGYVVYQRIYSSDEKELILKKINEKDLPRTGISLNHKRNILEYVEKKKLHTLEELLVINGIGPKVLRKICDSVLSIEDDEGPPKCTKKSMYNLVSPVIDENKKKNLVEIVAIHVGIGSIGWALLNSLNKDLLDWGLQEISDEKGSLYSQLSMVEDIVRHIPEGDIYLIEDNGIGRNRVEYKRHLTTALLSSVLQTSRRKVEGDLVIAFLKPKIKNSIYNGTIGSEKISLQRHVLDMIEERSQTDCISFPDELKKKFFNMQLAEKEDMAQALLLATAFINTILNQRESR